MRSLLTLTLAGAALSAAAPAALANTAVSRESGSFGTALSGDYVWVTDPVSAGDKRMEVQVTRVGNEIKVTDANGAVNAHGDDCREQGAAVFCKALGLEGLKIEGGNQNDLLASDVDLPTVFYGDGGDDLITSGPNDDQLHGDNGDDTLRGGAGKDSFTHEKGKDTFDGDADRDTVSYNGAPNSVDVTLSDFQFNDGLSSERDRILETESAIGSAYKDSLEGSDEPNTLSGRAGDDTISGLGGNDLLDGDGGDDNLHGDAGEDRLTYADRTAPVDVTLNHLADDGEAGEQDNVDDDIETIEGGAAGDSLSGSATLAAAYTLNGNGGNDTLTGGPGADTLNGGLGGDTLKADPGSDRLRGDSGTDKADYSGRSGEFTEDLTISPNSLTVNDDGGASDGPEGARDDVFGVEIVVTGDGNDIVKGTDFNDTIITGDGNDVITGGLGVDAIDAGADDDTLFIRDGVNDTLVKCGSEVKQDKIQTDPFPLDFKTVTGQLQLDDCEDFLP